MNQPTPAIATQAAVRRLPRLALLLLCVAYVFPGFVGREPWKNADMAAFGYMAELARTNATDLSTWLAPRLLGQPLEGDALLPHWLGAWAIRWAPAWIAPDFAARLPFIGLLALTLMATWYGVYQLARSPGAQPVALAFGGEAQPRDYARAIADGGLLALLACLGLAQLSHETTPALAQLCFTALTFHALACVPGRRFWPLVGTAAGLVGLTLSGAPTLALLFGAGGATLNAMQTTPESHISTGYRRRGSLALLAMTLLAASTATVLNLWQWRVVLPGANWPEWHALGRLLLWFTWPAWPLVAWTLWHWRRQLAHLRAHRHLALPLWFAFVTTGATIITAASSRTLLLALPALATLAAFALPTLKRRMAALIDWFTLLFFSGGAIIIWVVWIAMQTGVPSQPAANVARQAPGFTPVFSLTALAIALSATLAWLWLIAWRAGRHRPVLWKSLVLPASGAVLCWVLLMTLWLPLLDFARSYAPLVRQVVGVIGQSGCVQIHGLSRAQVAAFQFHGRLELVDSSGTCSWLIANTDALSAPPALAMRPTWTHVLTIRRPTDNNENIAVFKRVPEDGN